MKMKELVLLCGYTFAFAMLLTGMILGMVFFANAQEGKTGFFCKDNGLCTDPLDQCSIRYRPKVGESPKWICLPRDATVFQSQ